VLVLEPVLVLGPELEPVLVLVLVLGPELELGPVPELVLVPELGLERHSHQTLGQSLTQALCKERIPCFSSDLPP